MKMRLVAILQIRSHRFSDFAMWLNWYVNFIKCDEIYIVDDCSDYDITKLIELYNSNKNIFYYKSTDIDLSMEKKFAPLFNRQQLVCNYVMSHANLNENDIVLLPDDDEFWWYDTTKFSSFKECVLKENQRLQTSAIYVPWTLMRSRNVLTERPINASFAETFIYRTDIPVVEHKPILFYKGRIDTSFHNGYKDGKSITNVDKNFYYASTAAYNYHLRCYHYRFTTVKEFEIKRSSEISHQCKRPCFKGEFLHQVMCGFDQNDKYEIQDTTVLNELKNISRQ